MRAGCTANAASTWGAVRTMKFCVYRLSTPERCSHRRRCRSKRSRGKWGCRELISPTRSPRRLDPRRARTGRPIGDEQKALERLPVFVPLSCHAALRKGRTTAKNSSNDGEAFMEHCELDRLKSGLAPEQESEVGTFFFTLQC